MATQRSRLPALEFLPSLGDVSTGEIPAERTINPDILLDLAPDRESLFLSGKTIREIRRSLKLQINTLEGLWLHSVLHGRTSPPRERPARISSLIANAPPVIRDAKGSSQHANGTEDVFRRVVSGSALSGESSATTDFQTIPGPTIDLGSMSARELSTVHQLISPRPLGPTHVLVVSQYQQSARHLDTSAQRNPRSSATHALANLEVPVNDLLFVINSPNVTPHTPLPRRQPGVLQHVQLRVPHLPSFPELIVYMHTLDQAALFRAIIPDWIGNLLHPLPLLDLQEFDNTNLVHQQSGARALRQAKCSNCLSRVFRPGAATRKASLKISRRRSLFLCCNSNNNSTPSLSSIIMRDFMATPLARTVTSVAKDIAVAYRDSGMGAGEVGRADVLIDTVILLDALRDNLDYLGHFSKDLWDELIVTREILIRAIGITAKVDDGGETGGNL